MKAFKKQLLAIFLLAFLVYSNSLLFDFVLDDKIVITENEFTKSGIAGIGEIFSNDSMTGFFGKDKSLVAGGRYRPLSMSIHAIEWELFGENPFWYHLLNVLFYALSCCLLFLLLQEWFPRGEGEKLNGFWTIPFVAAAIFTVHPLHTEVVANIKSRDEILSILLALWSGLLAFRYLKDGEKKGLILSGVVFFASLLSKESSVIFLVLFPLAAYYFSKTEFKKIIRVSIPLLASTLAYVALRFAVIGSAKISIAKELMNNPFLEANTAEKFATISATLVLYLKLLIFPHPLTHDYYPKQIPIIGWDSILAIVGVALYSALIALAFRGLIKRNKWSFLIWLYLGGIALYSNVLFPIGTFMNERFLYVPTISLGILVAVVAINMVKSQKIGVGVVMILTVLLSLKTFSRNWAWETDGTLALTDVKVSSESAKCNMSAGMALIDQANEEKTEALKRKKLVEASSYLSKSLKIYPTYLPPTLLMGNALTQLKEYDQACDYYERCLQLSPKYGFAMQNLEFVGQEAIRDKDFKSAERAYLIYLGQNSENAAVQEKLGELYGKDLGMPDRALKHLEKALALKPEDPNKAQKLGIVYGLLGRVNEAIRTFETSLDQNPNNARLWLNLGITYQQTGQLERSQECLNKAFELEPALRNPA